MIRSLLRLQTKARPLRRRKTCTINNIFIKRDMHITTVPLNEDNYGYLVVDEASKDALFVDVSNQPETITALVREKDVNLRMILTTHHHWDHAGGNSKMLTSFPEVQICGHSTDNVEACNRTVNDGEEIVFGSIKITALLTPGHTMGHTCYYLEDGSTGQRVCFTGDCLFIGGAGRFFEGKASDMYPTLYTKLGGLPMDTQIYCGHEYTLSNYKFAASIDADNTDLQEQIAKAQALRSENRPTVPSTLDTEFKTNPFLRVHSSSVKAAMCTICKESGFSEDDPIGILHAVREAKNRFK